MKPYKLFEILVKNLEGGGIQLRGQAVGCRLPNRRNRGIAKMEGKFTADKRGPEKGSLRLYFLPCFFCATTSPRGVGRKTTDNKPSSSRRIADSRTVFRCELASCIRIRP